MEAASPNPQSLTPNPHLTGRRPRCFQHDIGRASAHVHALRAFECADRSARAFADAPVRRACAIAQAIEQALQLANAARLQTSRLARRFYRHTRTRTDRVQQVYCRETVGRRTLRGLELPHGAARP